MSGFLYRGRHCGSEPRPQNLGHNMDLSCDEVDKGPQAQTHSVREFEQHLNDLKKENFSLKLRIYFLEEKIQQKFQTGADDLHRTNIGLKVEVESLKKELDELQKLLDQTLLRADALSNQNEAQLQRHLEERQDQITHMQDLLETKVRLLQEEAELARGEAERMASLADAESQRCSALEREKEEQMEGGGASVFTQQALAEKDGVIEELTRQRDTLSLRVEELEVKVHSISSSEWAMGEQQSGLGQCVDRLQDAQDQVRSLQTKIRESETRNQKLQQRLGAMELELRSAREEAQHQERNLQNISDHLSSKEAEAADLYRAMEEQSHMILSLKETITNQTQLQASGAEPVRGQTEVVALQASLFQAELQLQAGEREQRRAARTQDELSRALLRLESDLQGALQHRRDTHTHNQELQSALDAARSALLEREEQLNEGERERAREREEREKKIRELSSALQTKDQLLQDQNELLDRPQDKTNSQLQRLRQRIRERDQALERAVDDKFRCVEEKEAESVRLRLLLRERDRDLETQRCVLSNNQETITSLELLVRGKSAELEQVGVAWRSVQRQQQEGEERRSLCLRERDSLVCELQGALRTRTQEAQELRCSLLAQVHIAPGHVLDELKLRLQLKDRLFQEVLADRTRQAQEHQDQVQSLLASISSRDQDIQESARRLDQVMTEQTSRLQELRRQLCSASARSPHAAAGDAAVRAELQAMGEELQATREELSLALRREKEGAELSRSQTLRLDAMSRTLRGKDDIIRDLQSHMTDPSGLPLVERLTQEVQELRESLVQRGGALGHERPDIRQPEFGDPSSEGEDEDDEDEDVISDETESVDDDEDKLKLRAHVNTKVCAGAAAAMLCEGQGLLEVQQLVEQKMAVERELMELKLQLEKSGFTSLSHMRKTLLSLRDENQDLNRRLQEKLSDKHEDEELEEEGEELEEEEEELDVTIEGEEEEELEEEEESEMWENWDHELSLSHDPTNEEPRRHRAPPTITSPPQGGAVSCLDQNLRPRSEEQNPGQRSRDLRERLMVSEATVQVQVQQLKDYRDLLTEASVVQESKQNQVQDLQDPGYETCGRSENEAEREDASSPEFDDLEMCTSLDLGSDWWMGGSGAGATKGPAHSSGEGEEAWSLRRLVEELRSQLSRSQAVIRGLQNRLRSLSAQNGPSTPRKVNWSLGASPSQSGAEDDEGWLSSDGGPAAPTPRRHDPGLQELESRVDALENHLRKGGKKSPEHDGKSATRSGKFDSLIQSQARELSVLRQRLREGGGLCNLLTQHADDITKAFEELLRSNDIDYFLGQNFRQQLSQSSALTLRLAAKISARDQPEDPEEKTELLAIRLSKELQQKDKIIESLRSKLNQHHHHHLHHSQRSDTPCSSHALSDLTDQSDRISYVSDDHGSTHDDLDLGSDAGELGPDEAPSSGRAGTDVSSVSIPPSIAPSCPSCPSMHCSSSPHRAQTGFSSPQSKPLPFTPPQPDSSHFLPLSLHGYQPSPFGAGGLDPGFAMKTGPGLLESSALWDMSYGARPGRPGAELSSGSSGYQSGTSHTGSELMKEHLREVRSLRQKLEDSINTNDRLRKHLEGRLSHSSSETGAPTNIYIQGLDSVSQLSSELRLLKEENMVLQKQLRNLSAEGSKEAEQLRERAVLDRAKLKEAELELDKWAEQHRSLKTESEAHEREIQHLKQERERSQETINRLQHEVNVLQQQVCESRSLVQSLQSELQVCHRVGGVSRDTHSGEVSMTFDPRDLQVQLEKQLREQPPARRRLFNENVPSPPVRDSGPVGPSSPLRVPRRPAGGVAPPGDTQTLGPAPSGRHGNHVTGHMEDFRALQQQILEGNTLLCQMEAGLRPLVVPALQEFDLRQVPDPGSVRKLLTDVKTLRHFLDEADANLRRFWRTEPTKGDGPEQDQLVSLRLKLCEQEQALRDAMEIVKSSNRTKDKMEEFIISQLSRTRDVLKKAKTNLQENQIRISTLGQTSSSAYPPPFSSSSSSSSPSSSFASPPSSSSLLRCVKGENAGGLSVLCSAPSPGWSLVTPPPRSTFLRGAQQQRPLQAAFM